MLRKNKKGDSSTTSILLVLLIGISVLLFLLYGPLSNLIKAKNVAGDTLNPPCQMKGGVCQKEECKQYLEGKTAKGEFKCKADEYCCLSSQPG